MHTINIHQVPDEHLPKLGNSLAGARVFVADVPSSRSRKLVFVFSLSILCHLALLGYFIYGFADQDSLKTTQQSTGPKPLKSYLFTKTPSNTRAQSPIAEEPEKAQTEAQEKPLKQEIAETEQAPVINPASTQQDASAQASNDVEQAKPTEPKQAGTSKILRNTSDKVSQGPKLKLSQQDLDKALQNYQTKRNTQALQRMAETEAKAYQEQKISPDLNLNEYIEQPELEVDLRDVDCTSGAKKTLAIISGMTGGRIQCKEYDIQSFIDKRLDKDTDKQE